jgi:DNA-binding CsgD family transcriptional regulator
MELTYGSVDEALVDALARLQRLREHVREHLGDAQAARELEIVSRLIEALRAEIAEIAELQVDVDPAAEDGDAVHRADALPPMPRLTPREGEVLQLMALGLRNKEIAGHLGVSERTAAFHVGNVLSKLGADGRVEAIHLARQCRLLHESDVRLPEKV